MVFDFWAGTVQVSTLTFNPCFKVKFVLHTKKALFAILCFHNVKTTSTNSRPAKLFTVSNCTFGICFKVKRGHHTKRPFISLIVGLGF